MTAAWLGRGWVATACCRGSPKSVIPTQPRVTEQLTKNWAPFKVLRQSYAGKCFEEHRQLHLPQKHKATVADSTPRVEMNGLEEQADNVKAPLMAWHH